MKAKVRPSNTAPSVNRWEQLVNEIDEQERQLLEERKNEESEEKKEPSKLEQLLFNPIVTKILFTIATGYMVFSLVTDWLLVKDVLRAKEGLVFGPPSEGLRVSFVIIISIGTILSILDFINLVRLTFFYDGEEVVEKGVISEDSAQAITSLIYEVPAISVALILSMCRDEPFSIFQTVKAVIALLGSFLHAVSVAIHYLRKHDKGFRAYVERVIISLSSIYIFSASLTLFIFTYTPKDPTIPTPKIIRSNTIDHGRYLYKVGVYYQHPSFFACSPSSDLGWLQTAYIYSLTNTCADNRNDDAYFTYSFDHMDKAYVFTEGASKREPQCFYIDFKNSCLIQKIPIKNCSDAQINMRTISLAFSHEKKSIPLPYGNIRFNGLKYNITNPQCEKISKIENSTLYGDTDKTFGRLLYLRSNNETQSIFEEQGSVFQFFTLGTTVRSVERTWKTGYFDCPMTGSLYPRIDNTLPIKYKYCT